MFINGVQAQKETKDPNGMTVESCSVKESFSVKTNM